MSKKRFGKRERNALAGKSAKRAARVNANMKAGPEDAASYRLRQTKAYVPPVELLTAGGRGRVVHNATGSDDPKGRKRLHPGRFARK